MILFSSSRNNILRVSIIAFTRKIKSHAFKPPSSFVFIIKATNIILEKMYGSLRKLSTTFLKNV